MKLYTEEQIKKAIKKGYFDYFDDDSLLEEYVNESLKNFTPIELPSDEEIDKQSYEFYPIKDSLNEMIVRDNWVYGAKWVIEQIKNKQQ